MKKQVVLITGGTRGIGEAIAAHFESQGAILILTGTDASVVEARNEKCGRLCRYVQTDFADKLSLRGFLEFIERLDRLDVCVNNAGINIIKPLETITEADLDRITAVNYRAPYLISQAAANVMKKQKGGRIVNIASIWSRITKQGRSLYCGSKAGLVGSSRAMASDLAQYGILVNTVSPGFTMTDLTRASLSQNEIDHLSSQVPLGRFAEPKEIAKLVYFLGSHLNTYITGQNIMIDGGFTNV